MTYDDDDTYGGVTIAFKASFKNPRKTPLLGHIFQHHDLLHHSSHLDFDMVNPTLSQFHCRL